MVGLGGCGDRNAEPFHAENVCRGVKTHSHPYPEHTVSGKTVPTVTVGYATDCGHVVCVNGTVN